MRPDRQSELFKSLEGKVKYSFCVCVFLALLFSATFRKKVERLCRDVLMDPVRIVIGDLGEANTDITQVEDACTHTCTHTHAHAHTHMHTHTHTHMLRL